MKIKRYKYFIFGTIIMIGIILYSFYSYFSSGVTISKEDMNALTLTFYIVENTAFSNLQLFSPLIISFIVIGTIQSEFNSGIFKNYLLRVDYKKYLLKTYKIVLISALLMPLSIILIFIISCIVTKFNFNYTDSSVLIKGFNDWKYNNFILYGILICIIQYIISLLYANIGLICVKSNKNKLVSIIMSYVMFFIVYMTIYFGYVFIINRALGIKELSNYFNIVGYWFFENDTNLLGIISLAFIFQFISFVYLYQIYKRKEKVLLYHEKQVS